MPTLKEYPANHFENLKEKLESGAATWVVLSGKMCSGKDFIAAQLPLENKTILSYGNLLREMLSDALASVTDDFSLYDAGRLKLGYTDDASKAFQDEVNSYPLPLGLIDPWSRTTQMRTILQNMGSAYLPYEDYLPKRLIVSAKDVIESGGNIVSVGGRFLPDVEIPKLAGALTVRLEVTLETQLRRLKARDGLTDSPELRETLNHPGETALDDYAYDLRIDNNGPDTEVNQIEIVNKTYSLIKELTENRRKF
jgi:hypothetical protein